MRGTALVADDDVELLETIAEALEHLGLTVVRATNGAEMVQALSESSAVDLVVADISMPWMTGTQAALSARRAGLHMPIVLITALEGDALSRQLAALGPVEATVLHKPFSLAQLIDSIRVAVPGDGVHY